MIMEDKKYPKFEEEENTGMVSEPAAGCVSVLTDDTPFEFKYPQGYDGFHTEDADEFERYKSELIAEAMNDGPGFTWNEVKKQIKDRHPWLR